jgi:hypothetical protein
VVPRLVTVPVEWALATKAVSAFGGLVGTLFSVNHRRLQREAIEQLMRMTADESLVARLVASDSPEATLGRLSPETFNDLVPGCPLLALLASGAPVEETWRLHYTPAAGSLYSTLEFFRTIDTRSLEDLDSYREFLERRRHCESRSPGPMLEL